MRAKLPARIGWLVALSAIFGIGCALSMWYGGIGMHPLDSPIVFDGAWRLLQGQTYFQDFNTPNGFVPIGMQAVFFKVFGVNWWAYRLHAGVLNGLFGVLAMAVLRLAGARPWIAAGYGLLSTIVFYPPMGVPYLEQHAYFFILLGIFCALAATKATGARQIALLATLPAIATLSILSKQNPGFFSILLVFIVLVTNYSQFSRRSILWGMAIGAVGAVLSFWLFVGWPAGQWSAFWTYFWDYPSTIAAERGGAWKFGPFKTLRSFAWLPFQQLSSYNFFHRYLLYVPLLGIALEWGWRKWRKLEPLPSYPWRLLVLAMGIVFTSSFFMHSSQNQMPNGLPLVFVAIGLGQVFWAEWLRLIGESLGWQPQVMARSILLGALLLFGYGLGNALDFHFRVNAGRQVLDFDAAGGIHNMPAAKAGIGGLDYQAPFAAGDLDPGELLTWLDAHDGNFFLMGDLSCLYGLSGRPSIPPFLWMHEGLTMPKSDDPAFATTDQRLLSSLISHRVQYVIFEHPGHVSYMGVQLECFPTTANWVYERRNQVVYVGGFIIWHLRV